MAECQFHPLEWRLRPEVTSPVDRATMVSYKCSIHVSVCCVLFKSCMRFSSSVKNGGLSISAARWHARPEVT
jgi:hypothetical protein